VVVFTDRPPTVGVLDGLSTRLIGEFGVSDEVLVEVLRDGTPLTGRTPIARPSSMQEVEQHPCDTHDGWLTQA